MVNGDPTVLPRGWGSLTFRSAVGVVDMDFCPTHLRVVVVPWAAALGVKEAEAEDLGVPAPDQDMALPIKSRGVEDDSESEGSDDADDESEPVVEWSPRPDESLV